MKGSTKTLASGFRPTLTNIAGETISETKLKQIFPYKYGKEVILLSGTKARWAFRSETKEEYELKQLFAEPAAESHLRSGNWRNRFPGLPLYCSSSNRWTMWGK